MVIKKLATPVPVKGLGNQITTTDEYVDLVSYVDGEVDGKPGTACFTTEVHLVDDLKANILFGNDTMTAQGIVVDLDRKLLKFGRCRGLLAPLDVVASKEIKRIIKARATISIPPKATINVPISFKGDLPGNRDFLFEPDCAANLDIDGGAFAHIVDTSIEFVQVYNDMDRQVTLPSRMRLGRMVEYAQDGAYLAHPSASKLAIGNTKDWSKKWSIGNAFAHLGQAAVAMTAGLAAMSAMTPQPPEVASMANTSGTATQPTSTKVDPNLEQVMHHGVTVYGNQHAAGKIMAVVDEFPEIWTDRGTTVDVPEEEWMPIPLKDDATPKAARVYPVNARDRTVIDDTFDKMQAQGKMVFTSQPTPFSFPVFVVWRDTPTGRNGRVVVDIRALNKMAISDSYPMPLQTDVIGAVAGFPFISASFATFEPCKSHVVHRKVGNSGWPISSPWVGRTVTPEGIFRPIATAQEDSHVYAT